MNFSVVMSVYKKDKLDFLKLAFDSLINQTLRATEIIIVVDGELPKEIEGYLGVISNQYDEVKVLFQEENKGLANALNIGISAANYSIIARMDADDICFSDRFEKQINYLINNNIDVLGGQMLEFEVDKNSIISKREVPLDHDSIVKRMKFLNPFSHPTMIFKKEVFTKLGGYNVNVFPEDYDFFVRAYLNGFKLLNIEDYVLYYRLGYDVSSMFNRRRGLKFAKNEYKLYKNFYSLGFYNFFEFLFYSITKIPIRLLPTKIFKIVYNTLTR